MVNNSKTKGSNFEREIARDLSLWWSNGKRDDIFTRSDSSGARFTQRKKTDKDTAFQSGDIACSDPAGILLLELFSIEVKTGYGKKNKDKIVLWDVLDILDSDQKIPVIFSLWQQCENDAELANKEPMLIFRRNRRKKCIAFKRSYFSTLELWFGSTDYPIIKLQEICIMNLNNFFNWIPDIRTICKVKLKRSK